LTAFEKANVSSSNCFAMIETSNKLIVRYQENTVSVI